MSNRWHNYLEDGAVCFWTNSITERIPALRSSTAARCFLAVIDGYRRRYGVRLLAYVIMIVRHIRVPDAIRCLGARRLGVRRLWS